MKEYEQLSIRDHFMFGKICLKKENCQLILNALLNDNIIVANTDIEKYIKEYSDGKFVRLDLLAESDQGVVYNGELQHESKNPSRHCELPKRSRYYQAIIDTAKLPAGKHYRFLPETYIIFICTFDPFGKGLAKYTFDTQCNEIPLLQYNDYAHKIFFNTTANLNDLPQESQNMLKYIETGITSDTATSLLDNEVSIARLKEDWRAEYMLTLTHDSDVYTEGYDSGYDSGFNSRQIEVDSLNNALADKDSTIAQLEAEISKYRTLLKS